MSVKYVNFTKTKYFNLNSHTFGGRGRKKVSNTVPLEVLVSLNPYYPIKKKKKKSIPLGDIQEALLSTLDVLVLNSCSLPDSFG